jgi:DNA invertase Pin-like site-specific DNA recombinase
MIRERVNAGISRAKAAGKHCGRPFIDTKLEGRFRAALAAPRRPGLHKIAKQFGVGTGTVQRIAAPRSCLRAPNFSVTLDDDDMSAADALHKPHRW